MSAASYGRPGGRVLALGARPPNRYGGAGRNASSRSSDRPRDVDDLAGRDRRSLSRGLTPGSQNSDVAAVTPEDRR
jgi:hypothetical protein